MHASFYTINPHGNVPCMVFPDGMLLNENAACLTYIADKGHANLAPKEGSNERYMYLNQISFIGTELHKSIGALFNPKMSEEAREAQKEQARTKLARLARMLDGHKFLNRKSLTAADLYAYIVLSWCPSLGLELPLAPAGAAEVL